MENLYPTENLYLRYTDEDYALVLNVWRRELGLEPLV